MVAPPAGYVDCLNNKNLKIIFKNADIMASLKLCQELFGERH
jgi:hypothetical protein